MMVLSAPQDFVASYTPPGQLDDAALWFVYLGNQILIARDENGAQVPLTRDLRQLGLRTVREQYLGSLAGTHCFAAEVENDTVAPAGMQWSGLRAVFGALDDTLFALAGRAFQIIDWDRSHQFCGRCGTPTVLKEGERSRVCPSCAQLHYPRIAPAVMVMVRRGREFLLARSPHFPPGMYSALAGFSEPGETLEQTLVREVREEVSIEVENIRYFASQPWPFPHSLMIGCIGIAETTDINIDPEEIVDARWFSREDIKLMLEGAHPEDLWVPGKQAIARSLILAFANGEV
jgi:NAD+ diphosphatase